MAVQLLAMLTQPLGQAIDGWLLAKASVLDHPVASDSIACGQLLMTTY
jgi:hypothetical protein